MPTYAVLQKMPPEALDGDAGRYGDVDVLMVGSEREAESFLRDYRRRHLAACREWQAWDGDQAREWDAAFDAKFEEICRRHAVNTVIEDVMFEIVPVGQSCTHLEAAQGANCHPNCHPTV
jgi:hypothetical protein